MYSKNTVFLSHVAFRITKFSRRLRRRKSRTEKVQELEGTRTLGNLKIGGGGNAERHLDLDHPYFENAQERLDVGAWPSSNSATNQSSFVPLFALHGMISSSAGMLDTKRIFVRTPGIPTSMKMSVERRDS